MKKQSQEQLVFFNPYSVFFALAVYIGVLLNPSLACANDLGGNDLKDHSLIGENLYISFSNDASITTSSMNNIIASCKDAIAILDSNGDASISSDQVNDGSQASEGISTFSLSKSTFNCENIGINGVTLTVTDNADNTATCNANITVVDNQGPSPLCKNGAVSLKANGTYTFTAADVYDGATDNCTSVVDLLSISPSSVGCEDIGNTVQVTLTAIDNQHNTGTCTANMLVENPTPGILTCKETTVYLHDDLGTAQISGSSLRESFIRNCTWESINFATSPSSVDCSDIGEVTVVLTAIDYTNPNNIATCTTTVTVLDVMEPEAICHDITVALDENDQATITPGDIDGIWESSYFYTSFDNCNVNLSIDMDTFDCDDIGDNTVTMTVTDDSGNSSTCTSTITVESNLVPIVTCKDATIVLIEDQNETPVSFNDMIENVDINCELSFGLSGSPGTVSCSDVGNPIAATVIVTARFAGGNQVGTCTSMLTVVDNDAPSMLCRDITVELDANGQANIVPEDIDGWVSGNTTYPSIDGCSIEQLSIDVSSFDCSDIGIKQVTLTGTDLSGNSAQCVSNVIVVESANLPNGWQSTNIGQTGMGNVYTYTPCNQVPGFSILGGGNNTMDLTSDNVAFSSHSICGDATITAKIESIDPNGYGGIMIREDLDSGAKQVSLFSNMTNNLRFESRSTTNGMKQVNNFFKPSPIWLKLERQGDWVFTYYSSTGTNFQYVHAVHIPMQSCVELGLASFTYLPGSQTEAVFSNVSITNSNSSLAEQSVGTTPSSSKHELNTSSYLTANYSLSTVKLYPNPNNGRFTIQLDGPLTERTTLHIYNSLGKQVHSQQIQEDIIYTDCYLGQLPVGTYWLKIGEGQEYMTKPFTINR